MVKWGTIVLSTILALSLGSILKNSVCDVSKQNLGTGTIVMKVTCIILSIPLEWIAIILMIVGIIYLVFNEQ